MSSDFYKQFETPFDREVDRAIREANEASLAAFDQKTETETARRWEHIMAAKEAAGEYGVVLPLATARDILATLRGESNTLADLNPDLPAKMLEAAIEESR
jgi:hypothetical protein